MNDYLYHHGIRGQKWGIRRFQNEDGSLTPRGEKRYYQDDYGDIHKKKYADNYSDSKRISDSNTYSRGAARRINRRMLKGKREEEARGREADRLNNYKKRLRPLAK